MRPHSRTSKQSPGTKPFSNVTSERTARSRSLLPHPAVPAAQPRGAHLVVIALVLTGLLLTSLGSVQRARAQAPAAPSLTQMPVQLTSGAQVSDYLTKARYHGYVLLVRNGKTILSKGFGPADVQNKAPNTARTQWPMFGVEGFMIAIAMLKLQEQGRVNVHDELCTYIKGCPQAWRGLTIATMLNGHSPIGIYDPFADKGTIEGTIAQCKAVAPWKYTDFQDDSSCNRVLLSQVIEQVTHKQFGTAMRDLVFLPAGMSDTALVERAPLRSAKGYTQGYQAPPIQFGGYPLIYSTPADVERLDVALLGGKILTQRSVRALITPYTPDGYDPTSGLWDAYGTMIFKENTILSVLGITSSIKTNRILLQSSGPEWSGFMLDNAFSPDDGTIAIEMINDRGLFNNDADNTFDTYVATLLYSA